MDETSLKVDNGVELRKLPYPYKAALAICSDIDGCTFENFLNIHRFLNTSQETELGEGLGLEIGDSFWMYSYPHTPEHAFSYFEPDNKTPSRYAESMRALIKSGHLDVLHSYGNFGKGMAFSREFAVRALDELSKHGLKPLVWTNHGGELNQQSFGTRTPGTGDLKTINSQPNPAYHLDLLVDFGIRFFWESERYLTDIIGQERVCGLLESWFSDPAGRGFIDWVKKAIKYPIKRQPNCFDNSVLSSEYKKNSLLNLKKFRDGNELIEFKRYGFARRDWSEDLPFLISEKFLQHLIRKQGISILYIHMGDRRYPDEKPLSTESIESLKNLAEYFRRDEILVTTTARLLNYVLVHKIISMKAFKNENGIDINLELKIPEGFPEIKIDETNLSGLTFYVPNPQVVKVFFRNKELLTHKNTQSNGEAASVMIPWRFLEYPL